MSKYTTEVRYICENAAGYSESKGYGDTEQIIADSLSDIFNPYWEIFDEDYRVTLETKIIRHFYFREIGFETVALWKFKLNATLAEIMPKYNKLYELESYKFNPLWDTDISTTYGGQELKVRDTDNVHQDNSTAEQRKTGQDSTHLDGDEWSYYSDTPQGSVGRLDDLTYLTNATHDTTDNTTTTTYGNTTNTSGNTNGTDNTDETIRTTNDFVRKVSGKQGTITYGKVVQDYINSLLNIDAMIIAELEPLFMQLW